MAKLSLLFLLSLVLVSHAAARSLPVPRQVVGDQDHVIIGTESKGSAEVDNKVSTNVGKDSTVKDKKCLVGGFGAVGGVAGVGAVVPLVGGLGGASGLGGLGGLGHGSGLGGLGGLGKAGGIGGGGILP